jgi:UDP-MurNAc hydroxylase
MRATSIGHAGILIETHAGTIVCDPWFEPAFFGSWFVFPRNDRLDPAVMAKIEDPTYLYITHLHGDHLDEAFLAHHVSRDTTVLLPDYPTGELERRLRALGFHRFVHTKNQEEIDLGGITVAIHAETSITDGPGGDSAMVVYDGVHRLVNQNDCRTTDLGALAAHGPIDQLWLQYSGAIWYPMVYEEPADRMRELCRAKVDSQFARALRYIERLDPRVIVPSAGPPCFLDPDLFPFNVITGDEPSIFPDQTVFRRYLAEHGWANSVLAIPGTTIEVSEDGDVAVTHPLPDGEVQAIFTDKANYLRRYQADTAGWLAAHKATWHADTPDLVERMAAWFEPLMAMAPAVRTGIGAAALVRSGDLAIYLDFPTGTVRRHAGEPYDFRFDIPRPLLETVVAEQAVDWSNSLFLSCRFRAWRRGPFNEFLYNFLKSLSRERMALTEAEARRKLAPPPQVEELERCGFVFERFCPHRQADLAVFGEIEGETLTCTLHGWRFDLASGECLTAQDRQLRVRRAVSR